MSDNMITTIRKDVAVFRVVLEAGLEPTQPVLNGLWRWFPDVELALPLPVMPLSEAERTAIALDAIQEMDAAFVNLEQAWAKTTTAEERHELHTNADAMAVNALWREIAGCFAPLLNEDIPEIPLEEAEKMYSRGIEAWAHASGVPAEEIANEIRTNSMVRMQLRRQGLDPDKFRA